MVVEDDEHRGRESNKEVEKKKLAARIALLKTN